MTKLAFKRVALDDPRMLDQHRELVRAALTVFARKLYDGMNRRERRAAHLSDSAAAIRAAIELWELGFVRIVSDDAGAHIEPCAPDEAPQLASATATSMQ